jgi:NhaA family Na+:H+ antiporter
MWAGQPELLRGWAIPCATDIAFSYMAARVIFHHDHPAIPFLLLLAIADDALGLLLLALFYPSGPLSVLRFAALMIPAIGIALWFKRRRVRSFWPYIAVAGSLSWAALYLGGVHPALALVPIVPFMPHAKRDLGFFDDLERRLPDTMNRFEHWWRVPVQVIFFSALRMRVSPGRASALQPGSWCRRSLWANRLALCCCRLSVSARACGPRLVLATCRSRCLA